MIHSWLKMIVAAAMITTPAATVRATLSLIGLGKLKNGSFWTTVSVAVDILLPGSVLQQKTLYVTAEGFILIYRANPVTSNRRNSKSA